MTEINALKQQRDQSMQWSSRSLIPLVNQKGLSTVTCSNRQLCDKLVFCWRVNCCCDVNGPPQTTTKSFCPAVVEIANSISKFEGSFTQLEGFVVKLWWVEGKVVPMLRLKVLISAAGGAKGPWLTSSQIRNRMATCFAQGTDIEKVSRAFFSVETVLKGTDWSAR